MCTIIVMHVLFTYDSEHQALDVVIVQTLRCNGLVGILTIVHLCCHSQDIAVVRLTGATLCLPRAKVVEIVSPFILGGCLLYVCEVHWVDTTVGRIPHCWHITELSSSSASCRCLCSI